MLWRKHVFNWRTRCAHPDLWSMDVFISNSLVTLFEYCAPQVIFSVFMFLCVVKGIGGVAIPLNACHTQVCQCNHVSHLTYVSQAFCLRRDAEL